MRRPFLAVAILLLAGCGPQAIRLHFEGPPAPDVRSSPAKVECNPLASAIYDPIGGATHLHEFFGNRTSFGGQGTSCGNPNDTALYWVPALVYKATGQPVPLRNFFAYYRAFNHANVGPGDPYPVGARIVAGNAHNTAPLDTSLANWSCDQRSTRVGPYPDITAAACNQANGTVYLTAHIDFPTCWDGTLTGVNDTAHFAYTTRGVCPAGFPHETVELRETVKWDYRGDGSDVVLSSDPPGGVPGRTLHGDFLNTWNQAGFATFVADCVHKAC